MNIRIGDRSYGVKSYIKNFDKVLLGLIAVLLVFSMLCINSATYGSDAHSRSMIVQGVAIGLGFVLMIIVSKLDYDIISDLWKYIVVASSAALFLTALIAPEINGNRNWLMIGSVNIQTSEFTKICFAVTMSKHLAKLGEDLNKPKNILFVLIHFLAYLVPILLQGDIGTALIYIGIFVVLVFAAGIYYRYILIGALGVAGITPLLWNMMKDYQKLRILTASSRNSTRLEKAISRLFRGWLSARVNFGGSAIKKAFRRRIRFFPKSEPTSYMPLSVKSGVLWAVYSFCLFWLQ